MKDIYSLLESYQGEDRFSFVVTGPNGKVQLDFPNASTRYCPALAHDLERLVDSRAVRITPVN